MKHMIHAYYTILLIYHKQGKGYPDSIYRIADILDGTQHMCHMYHKICLFTYTLAEVINTRHIIYA